MTTFKPSSLSLAIASLASLSMPTVWAETFELEEIVVTAQKRAQSLNDVGIAVSAFTGDQMKVLGITNASDMAVHTPGLFVTDAGAAGVPVYTVRGVGFDDVSANSNGTVGLYVDEVAVAYPTMSRGMQFDMERVEVLKGPQGDLYGRNNTGGAINFVSNKPTDEFEAGVTLEYGRYDSAHVTGFVSGALSDTVNGRLAIDSTNTSEGWQKNIQTGETLGEEENFAARGLLSWAPIDTVDVLFNVHGYRDRSDSRVMQSFLAKPSFDATQYPGLYPYASLYGPWYASGFLSGTNLLSEPETIGMTNSNEAAIWNGRPSREIDSAGASMTINWDLERFSLTSITAYEDFSREEVNDWDGVNDFRANNNNATDISGWSQELRLSSPGDGDVSWIGGLYFSGDEVEEFYRFGFGDATNGGFGLEGADIIYEQETDIRAVFGHLEWQMAEQYRLTVGARYTYEERSFEGCAADVPNAGGFGLTDLYNDFLGFTKADGSPFAEGDCIQLSVDPTVPTGTALPIDVDPSTATWETDNSIETEELVTEKFTGKIGIDYTPNEDWLIYGSIGLGFKSGGMNAAPSNNKQTLAPYTEEELLAFEIGFKGTLLDNTMQFNGAIFHYDYDDKQVVDGIPDPIFAFLTSVRNVPKSQIDGLELELQWRPVQGLDIKLAGTWLDTEVLEFDDGFNFYDGEYQDFEGHELPNSADFSFNALVSYEWDLTNNLVMRATADYMYTDDYWSYMAQNSETDRVDSYNLLGARLGIGDAEGRWNLSLWGKNITDEYYYSSTSYANDIFLRAAGKGATYGVTFDYNF